MVILLQIFVCEASGFESVSLTLHYLYSIFSDCHKTRVFLFVGLRYTNWIFLDRRSQKKKKKKKKKKKRKKKDYMYITCTLHVFSVILT